MTAVASYIVDEFVRKGVINEDLKGELIRILSYRHKYVTDNSFKGIRNLKRNASLRSLQVKIAN